MDGAEKVLKVFSGSNAAQRDRAAGDYREITDFPSEEERIHANRKIAHPIEVQKTTVSNIKDIVATAVGKDIYINDKLVMTCADDIKRTQIVDSLNKLNGADCVQLSFEITGGLKLKLIASYSKNGTDAFIGLIEEDLVASDTNIKETILVYANAIGAAVKANLDDQLINDAVALKDSINKFDKDVLAARFANEDLSDYDRNLFVKYLIYLGKGEENNMSTVKNLIKNRSIYLNVVSLNKYDGKYGLESLFKEANAFTKLIEMTAYFDANLDFDASEENIEESNIKILTKARYFLIRNHANLFSQTEKDEFVLNFYWAPGNTLENKKIKEILQKLIEAENKNWLSADDYKEITIKSNIDFLHGEDKEMLKKYQNDPTIKNSDQVLKKINYYQYILDGTIWGSAQRAECKKRLVSLEKTAYAMGIEWFALSSAKDADYGAFFVSEWTREFMRFHDEYLESLLLILDTPEKKDDEVFKKEFLTMFNSITRKIIYLAEERNPNIDEIVLLSEMVGYYYQMAGNMGIDKSEMSAIEGEASSSIEKNPRLSKRNIIFRADDLPEGIKSILEEIKMSDGRSYFEYVKENTNYIIMSKVWTSLDSLANMPIAGMHVGAGTIILNPESFDLEHLTPYRAIELFATIVHEAHHVEWMRRPDISGDLIKNLLANEGAAFKFHYEANLKMLEYLPTLFKKSYATDEKEYPWLKNYMIKLGYLEAGSTATYGEVVKKCIEANMDFANELSNASNEILGKKNVRELDLVRDIDKKIYPTMTPQYVAFHLLDGAISVGAIKIEERPEYIETFKDLVTGKRSLADLEKTDKKCFDLVIKLLKEIDINWGSLQPFLDAYDKHYEDTDFIERMTHIEAVVFFGRKHQIYSKKEVIVLDANEKKLGKITYGQEYRVNMTKPKQVVDRKGDVRKYHEIEYFKDGKIFKGFVLSEYVE